MSNRLSLMSSFAVVVKCGSFTRAAERLALSKSVVSRHVTALEKELGVQLLYRSTHKLSLTEAGERFYAYCKDLEDVADQAVAVATAARERPRGSLRVTLPQTLVVSPLGKLIARFQEKFREVQLDVRVTSLQVDPIEEGFDIALRIGPLQDSALICRKLRDIRFQVVATPGYLKRHGRPRTRDELKQHNCLIYSEFGSRGRWPAQAATARRSPAPLSGNFSTNSGVLLLNALLAGQGIAIGPDIMFEPLVKRKQVRVILEDEVADPSGLYAVFPPGRFPSATRTAFMDFLVAALSSRATGVE
jgi:DNA-binding transcriptional LysR family regulator